METEVAATEGVGEATVVLRERPVHEVRFGRVKAAVWATETEHGVMFNVTVCRLYKDKDQRWKSSDRFARDDLLVLAKALDRAHSWVSEMAKGQESVA